MKKTEFEFRKSVDKDISAISELLEEVFRSRADTNYLKWLLADPDNLGEMNSIVAFDGDRLVGHIGYVKARHKYGDRLLSGVHIIAWVALPDYKGIGRKLYELALNESDISLIYEGTISATRAYPKLGYRQTMFVYRFSSYLNLPKISGIKSLRDISRLLLLAWRYLSQRLHRASFCALNNSQISFRTVNAPQDLYSWPSDSVVSNCPTRSQIEWLVRCPNLDSRVIEVYRNDDALGILLLFINKNDGNRKTGRIVHFPYMGRNLNDWVSVFSHAESEFRSLGCHSYNIYAREPTLIQALKLLGYKMDQERPAWVRDPMQLVASDAWHLTYIEGDHGFRGV